MPPKYVEYSVSHGPGTLIEHGVVSVVEMYDELFRVTEGFASERGFICCDVDAERYQEFIQIHGSERAV